MQVDAGLVTEMFEVYPTIIENDLTLKYIAPKQDYKGKVMIYNMWGQVVFEENVQLEEGYNNMKFNLSKLQMASGVYNFILNSNNDSKTVKLIKK